MKTRTHPIFALLLGAWLVVGLASVDAADTIQLPPSKITELNVTNMTFTVDLKGTNQIVQITSQTRFFRDGKYATTRDLMEGQTVRGVLKATADGRRQAVRIFWGTKSFREK